MTLSLKDVGFAGLIGTPPVDPLFQADNYNYLKRYQTGFEGTGTADTWDMKFSTDGTIMILVDASNINDYPNSLVAYTLSTAWDIGTATFSKSKSLSANTTNPVGFAFKPDGLRLIVLATYPQPSFYEYTLSTAWDIATLSAAVQSWDWTGIGTYNPLGLQFNDDGSKLYSNFYANGDDGFASWDLGPGDYTLNNIVLDKLTTITGCGNVQGFVWTPDGTKLYLVHGGTGTWTYGAEQWNCSTPWDQATAVDSGKEIHWGTADPPRLFTPHSGVWDPSGDNFYIVNRGGFEGVAQFDYTAP